MTFHVRPNRRTLLLCGAVMHSITLLETESLIMLTTRLVRMFDGWLGGGW